MAGLLGLAPTAVLGVPCLHDDEVVGVLELVDKVDGTTFTFDDVELATLLANVAGAALRDVGGATQVRSPDELAADLRAVAAADPSTYAAIAAVVETLLARG